ncbi:hypothetical protein VDBG_07110 [Verticillium alfalfae VaMs.102]|uniref:Uncharacterized protein n=1 Tax=Verticillium alfalfae (strain VaMs.102 / ATCC MYA-4576 / FGSC 10136) TaxID=526221 RepID=C9SQ75_VERA1|nr:hypothetical protein VDBG_07110 [Verticillium alfalfae VaMs.102]EEY21000.1 hypothetical protein VDBG_07110 [Verticillium alfalfae VaMs.102]
MNDTGNWYYVSSRYVSILGQTSLFLFKVNEAMQLDKGQHSHVSKA